jgi:hypothetical protein
MLTPQEKEFLQYWESHREAERSTTHRLLYGLPRGLCFGLPILVCFIFRSWYKWLPFVSGEELLMVAIGVFAIVLFYSLFRQQYLWERKEQQYLELKAKEPLNDAP